MRYLDDLFSLSRHTLSRALSRALECTLTGPSARPPGGALAVDCTAGNGHDALFLAERVGETGRVWAFDVQRSALDHTAARLRDAALLERTTLVEAGHERLAEFLPPEAHGHIHAATFNLGFLPGSDKRVITRADTTLTALETLAAFLAPGGVISAHCYAGHPGGAEETERVAAWFSALPWKDWRVTSHSFANKKTNPETLFLAERQ